MKKILIVLFLLVAIISVAILGSGIMKEDSVDISSWSFTYDSEHLNLGIEVTDSVGYVRKVKSSADGERLCLDFISAFGGINGRIGAKNGFIVNVPSDIYIISVYRGPGRYEDVLKKNGEGNWQKIEQ